MGNVFFGAPKDLILLLARALNLELFVETGTFEGETAGWAASHFRHVYSVELSNKFFDAARKELAGTANITLEQGESGQFLRDLLLKLNRPTLFWLDAHWCGPSFPGGAGELQQCPLLDELHVICLCRIPHAIVIDDAHHFLAPSRRWTDYQLWPTISEVLETLNTARDRYIVVVDDCIVSVPISARDHLKNYCLDAYSRQSLR